MPTHPNYAYFQGKIVPIEEAKVSVMTHALHYGTGAFGGLRGYWNANQEELFIFRPADHFARLLNSAKLLRMELPYTPQRLVEILVELMRMEGLREDCYIRPLIYKSTPTIGVRLHDLDDDITIFTIPFGRYLKKEEGLHLTFSSWRRVDDNAIPARGKITGAYANSAQIYTDAVLAGFDDALVTNDDGHVSEGSAANFFMIRDGVAITPPISSNILEGITRRSIMHLLRTELDLEVVERQIDRTEVYVSEEAFLCGTGVQLAAITRVDNRSIGSGQMGPITKQIRDLYFSVVRGQVSEYRHWNQPVYAETPIPHPGD